jgi:PAS domain S-box-containing protein
MSMMTTVDVIARTDYEPGAESGTALLEGLPIGVYRTSPEGRVLMANSALLRMLGYASLEELSARDLNREFEPGYTRSEFRQALERDGEVVGLESFWTRKDGSSFYARENARAVREEGGSVLYFEGTVEDVTSRRRVEEECRALLEIVQGLNATYDLDELFSLIHRSVGRVLYAENFLIALYNPETGFLHFEFFVDKHDPMPPPRPLGKGLSGYVINNDLPLLLSREEQRHMVEKGMVEGVVGTFSASWLGVPLRTPSGAIGVLVVQHYEEEHVYAEGDVEFLTSVAGQVAVAIERRRAEVALRHSEAELKKFAAKLEASNRELQDFASVASHDLQEPLRKIQAFGDRLKTKYADALGEGGRDYLERMQNAAGRMQTLINDLLTFSRVTTKAQPRRVGRYVDARRRPFADASASSEPDRQRLEVPQVGRAAAR